jgi:hypothetical protein
MKPTLAHWQRQHLYVIGVLILLLPTVVFIEPGGAFERAGFQVGHRHERRVTVVTRIEWRPVTARGRRRLTR